MDHYYQLAVVNTRFDQNVQKPVLLKMKQAHHTDIKQVVHFLQLLLT